MVVLPNFVKFGGKRLIHFVTFFVEHNHLQALTVTSLCFACCLNVLFAACLAIKSDFTDKNFTLFTNKLYTGLFPFAFLCTSQSCDLFQLCLCTATIVEKDEPYKPFSPCRAGAVADRGPQPQACLCSSTLSFDFSNFFFSQQPNVEADAKLQNQAVCSGKLTELKSQYDWKLDKHGPFTLPVKQILRVLIAGLGVQCNTFTACIRSLVLPTNVKGSLLMESGVNSPFMTEKEYTVFCKLLKFYCT